MGFGSLGLTTICLAQMVYHLCITGSTLRPDWRADPTNITKSLEVCLDSRK